MTGASLLGLIPLVPLLAVPGIVAARHNPNLREGVTLTAGVVLFFLVAALAATVQFQAPPSLALAEPVPGLASLCNKPD